MYDQKGNGFIKLLHNFGSKQHQLNTVIDTELDFMLVTLKELLDKENYHKLEQVRCAEVHKFVVEAIHLCKPQSVWVVTDKPEETARIRQRAIEIGEEIPLAIEGHTVHFDGYYDQARDVRNTRYLIPKGEKLDATLNQIDREKGIAEIYSYLDGSMRGKEMIVRFFSLGPLNSPFSILTVQITDSYYVAHSLDLLYRPAYKLFTQTEPTSCFKILHSSGHVKNNIPVDIEKRRIYIDYKENTVYSVNTTYAGNTVGLKKLAFRLAIRKANEEGWLAEHMFILAVKGKGGRKTYLTGAYPSGCGKTSTAMILGESIVGDDLAYLKRFGDEIRTVNVEKGIFGIITGVNAKDDPIIFECLTSSGEVIFSNVLVHEGKPYWLDDGREHPDQGINFAGKWHKGMIGPDGEEVPAASRNARYTIRLTELPNLDTALEDPQGVPLGGIIYGGRDSDTSVPVWESFNWVHGVITIGASLESETTAATLGKEGVRKCQPFSNLDFLSIPLGRYIQNHLNFVVGLSKPPKIFGVNYFLKNKQGAYLNSKQDKRVWLKWMDRRIHGEMEAITTPIGLIPKFADLVHLFEEVLEKTYTLQEYNSQFLLRIPELLAKNERVTQFYHDIEGVPAILFEELGKQKERLLNAQEKFGDYILPEKFG